MKNDSNASKKRFFESGKSFVISQIAKLKCLDGDKAEKLIHKHLVPEKNYNEGLTINDIYKQLIASSQNANMKAGVIGRSLDGKVESLGRVLCEFDPAKFIQRKLKADDLLNEIREHLKPRGRIRDSARSIWPQFCRTAIAGANFLNQFKKGDDFVVWAKHFYDDQRSISALPLLIKQEIPGFGYALACDFLKELGFVNYGKPDVHIKDIFIGCGVCEEKTSDYALQKTIREIAGASGTTPFAVDKIFWMIGSGQIGPSINIGGKKKEFIEMYQQTELYKSNAFQ